MTEHEPEAGPMTPERWTEQQWPTGHLVSAPEGAYRTSNVLASWSLVLALLWGFGIFSLVAVIFGHTALGQIRERRQDGKPIAVVGLMLGYLGLTVAIVPLLFLLILMVVSA